MSSTIHSTIAGHSRKLSGVYLIHFHSPFGHARHYLGWSSDIPQRIAKHIAGEGARLTEVVAEAGIGMLCVRLWPFASRELERKLKGHHSPKLCPVCNTDGWQRTCSGVFSFAAGYSKGIPMSEDVDFYGK